MNETSPRLEKLIYLIRGQKVMLDQDIAQLYAVETRILTRAVRRNMDRFPDDFMFTLSVKESADLRSQIGISSSGHGGRRYQTMAFTEQGVAMLSSVLKSKPAIKVNIEIMRAFVKLREILATNTGLAQKLETLERKYDYQFKAVFDAISEIMNPTIPPKKQRIGFGAR
jgi:ORF6N domain